MDELEYLPSETQPDEQTNVGSADVNETVSQPKASDSMLSLDEINAITGKNFKDKETALKSIKETQSFVGKRKEDIAKELGGNTAELSNQLKQIKENLFYKDNPQYAAHRELISKLGDNPEDAVSLPAFKSMFEKADGYEKTQSLKSVLVSNPRLASSKDNLSKAREAQTIEDREKYATSAVLDLLNK